jgi:hypothetical protein
MNFYLFFMCHCRARAYVHQCDSHRKSEAAKAGGESHYDVAFTSDLRWQLLEHGVSKTIAETDCTGQLLKDAQKTMLLQLLQLDGLVSFAPDGSVSQILLISIVE